MDKWEFLRVSVSYKDGDKIDFVSKRDKALPSIATHDGMDAYFNITHKEWETYLQSLKDEGWELENVETRRGKHEESYYFKREKKR